MGMQKSFVCGQQGRERSHAFATAESGNVRRQGPLNHEIVACSPELVVCRSGTIRGQPNLIWHALQSASPIVNQLLPAYAAELILLPLRKIGVLDRELRQD